MRAVTHHCTSTVLILPNNMSRERLGTHTQSESDESSCCFSFIVLFMNAQKKKDSLQRLRASFADTN